MELHAAMETFAEAWIAANMQNYVIDTQQQVSQIPKQELTHYILDHHNNLKNTQKNNQKVHFIQKTENNEIIINNNINNEINNNEINNNNDLVTFKSPQLTQTATSLLGVRTISLRCVVEQEESMATTTLNDCQVFLPGSLLFLDIVRGALLKLGFAVSEAIAAKGSIQLQNWNAVEVERLTDNSRASIEEMLGHVAAICTLRIKLNKLQMDEIEWDEQAVRSAVLKLLKNHNQVHLSRMCPIPQSMISNIANSKYSTRMCTEKCKEFGQWFAEYQQGVSANTIEYPPSSTRITFHPIYELPLLRKWYFSCPNPSTDELKKFLRELNMAPVRQEREKIPLRRLRVWWRNEKQRLKRCEEEGVKVVEGGGGRKRKKRKKKKMLAQTQQHIDIQEEKQADNQDDEDKHTDNHTDNQEYTEECYEERGDYIDPPRAHHTHPLTTTTLFHDPLYTSSLFQ